MWKKPHAAHAVMVRGHGPYLYAYWRKDRARAQVISARVHPTKEMPARVIGETNHIAFDCITDDLSLRQVCALITMTKPF